MTTSMAVSHIIYQNPVMKQSEATRRMYYQMLQHYVKIGKSQGTYPKTQIKLYRKALLGDLPERGEVTELKRFGDTLPIDYLHILGYEKRAVQSIGTQRVWNAMTKELKIPSEILQTISSLVPEKLKDTKYRKCCRYLSLAQQNLIFCQKKPVQILVTATMSAGKSTFINALTGQRICRTMNMACTSKLNYLIGKPFDDHTIGKYDYDLELDADSERLWTDHEKNDKSIYFNCYMQGQLGGERLMLVDSPGVNFSQDNTHKQITDDLIAAGKCRLLLYVMDATQLQTDDMTEHLMYVKQKLGRKKILFILNKIDHFEEQDDLSKTIADLESYLTELEFWSPVILPVSAKIALLAKRIKNGEELNRREQTYFENAVLNYVKGSERYLDNPTSAGICTLADHLLRRCGMTAIEEKITQITKNM